MICSRCGVKLDGNKAIFSYGKAGDKQELYSKVCSRAIKAGRGDNCINDCRDYNAEKDFPVPLIMTTQDGCYGTLVNNSDYALE